MAWRKPVDKWDKSVNNLYFKGLTVDKSMHFYDFQT